MEKNKTHVPLYAAITAVTLLAIGAFFLIFNELSGLRVTVDNLQAPAAAPAPQTPSPEPQTPPPAPASTPPAPPALPLVAIPTAIIFPVESSPTLQPQTSFTVVTESVARSGDGTVTVYFRVYSNQATSYSAFNSAGAFQLINLNGENQPPTPGTGSFGSIPPESVTAGTVTFPTDPARDTIILQTGSGDNPTFYEFNFANKTYKKTVIG